MNKIVSIDLLFLEIALLILERKFDGCKIFVFNIFSELLSYGILIRFAAKNY